ncbi:hypothetical protein D9757_014697 [Collybiopsis confluens]|uniref:Uncharacterized protein n=1 Tax=Collybiopsis confluens TaxID=2823264 RepID=A0A8H5CCA1_9AGAR|nr:hypothetical protein D9757_014697 [Collybiopsis confluens]
MRLRLDRPLGTTPLFTALGASVVNSWGLGETLMDSATLSESQIVALAECIANGRLHATATLFIQYMRGERRLSLGKTLFILARYSAMIGTIQLGPGQSGTDLVEFLGSLVASQCQSIASDHVTIILSSIKIIRWRKTIPEHVRAPFIDMLWRDVLGLANIIVVLQPGIPQIRSAAAQLQAVIHSILSTRLVLRLQDIAAPGCSVIQQESKPTVEFASRSGFTSMTSSGITFSTIGAIEFEEEEQGEIV